MEMNIPIEVGYNGGVSYRWYPGGVECVIEYPTKDYRETVSAFIATSNVEKYDRVLLANEAYDKAVHKIG